MIVKIILAMAKVKSRMLPEVEGRKRCCYSDSDTRDFNSETKFYSEPMRSRALENTAENLSCPASDYLWG